MWVLNEGSYVAWNNILRLNLRHVLNIEKNVGQSRNVGHEFDAGEWQIPVYIWYSINVFLNS